MENARVPKLEILPQFLQGGELENEFKLFVVNNAPSRLRPENYDVYSAAVRSGLEPYSIGWYQAFFESVLGADNVVYANSKKMFSPQYTSLKTNFYYTNVNRFLETFTNVREVSESFISLLRSIGEDEPLIVSDPETSQYYSFLYTYALTTRASQSVPCGAFLVNGRTAVFCAEKSVKEMSERKSPLRYLVRPVSIRP